MNQGEQVCYREAQREMINPALRWLYSDGTGVVLFNDLAKARHTVLLGEDYDPVTLPVLLKMVGTQNRTIAACVLAGTDAETLAKVDEDDRYDSVVEELYGLCSLERDMSGEGRDILVGKIVPCRPAQKGGDIAEAHEAPLQEKLEDTKKASNARGRVLVEMLFRRSGDTDWMDYALCAETDPEIFFPGKGKPNREARQVCSSCEVRSECLEYALDNEERFGVWGGYGDTKRRKLKKKHKK